MTVGIPQYTLSVVNEPSPQPTPTPPPVPPVVIPLPDKTVDPSPANGSSTNYPSTLLLSWGNGGGATSYVIWLDGMFKGTQAGTSFNPGLLATSTSYSWRIDSLNEGGITIGDTWTFSTANQVNPPPPPTPPLAATSPSPANGASGVDPTSVTLSWTDGGGALSFDIYLNGVFQANQASASFLAGALLGLTAYTWRIDSVNAVGTTTGTTWSFTTTTLVPLPSKPTTPTPVDGEPALDPVNVTLSWVDGGGADSYDVYINGVFQGNQVGTSFNAGDLIAFDSYTWRIDAVNVTGTTTGDTWTFDTTGHATVVAWAARVVTNGGAAPSLATKRALHDFCVGLDTDSLTSLMVSVNCLVPDNLIAAATPLFATIGNDPWTNNNFVAGGLTVNGLIGNGANTFFDTGIVPSFAFANDTSCGVTLYIAVPDFSADNLDAGCVSGTNILMFVSRDGSPANTDWDCYNNTVGQGRTVFANPSPGIAGYYSGNRTAANASSVYIANSGTPHYAAATIATTGGARPANELYFFAAHIGAGGVGPTRNRLSFLAVHLGLSATESANFYTRIQALRTALGGGYV